MTDRDGPLDFVDKFRQKERDESLTAGGLKFIEKFKRKWEWEEQEHRRRPAGSEEGGRFIPTVARLVEGDPERTVVMLPGDDEPADTPPVVVAVEGRPTDAARKIAKMAPEDRGKLVVRRDDDAKDLLFNENGTPIFAPDSYDKAHFLKGEQLHTESDAREWYIDHLADELVKSSVEDHHSLNNPEAARKIAEALAAKLGRPVSGIEAELRREAVRKANDIIKEYYPKAQRVS